MAEDVINSMVNMKLTSEEEEEIQISDEDRPVEIDSCVLSLIGKFLTCKPYNRKAAKNTLRKAWGLDKGLQISEVGSNLFQFKFQSDFELERILRGGPWTFNNQLLMLTRWKTGMSANNVVLEHASLWVQIWGVPFDMMSPTVATEIGKRMGVVEDVERRKRADDLNLFLRVKVGLPISKPIRRGGFLMGSDGKRHWVDYKYERLPFFCHFCGILGHDIRHCPPHFEASKKTTSVEYQYGDWLRVVSARNKSPPRRQTEPLPKEAPLGKEDNPAEMVSEVHTAGPAAARAATAKDGLYDHYGKGGQDGSVTKIQAQITEGNYSEATFVESHVPGMDSVFKPNEESKNGPALDKNELGQAESHTESTKRTWTRINRMNFGPSDEPLITNRIKLGKRPLGDALEEKCETETIQQNQKRAKVKFVDGMDDYISAEVEDHPCRKP
ncbi:uncharacterized protein LOC115956765 [Quercus lobata]|uniref:uncharacterized protein LOC115956765 n=1 Tax=Quercus lobata TaxID=97700 RepID=UPI001246DF44|nr:uncharacterized protein LOC115956765 [Quercus lobata]